MSIELIGSEEKEIAAKKLALLYTKQIIVEEKKPYISDLARSLGPYLAVESNGKSKYILDAASQIATLGLGFSPLSLFGTAHHLDSWDESAYSESFYQIKISFSNLFKRHLKRRNIELNFCHSGAEANEIALGHAFNKRKDKSRKKVLAFEGSFHGRMLVSLSSTWNKSKREPFEWDDYKTVYNSYPSLRDGNINRVTPEDWLDFWDEKANDSKVKQPKNWEQFVADNAFKEEVNSLLEVIENFKTNKIFACIIEPMQCEGGDKYSSSRFHRALSLICKNYDIPLIYDEVQTGFHLGRKFFWHQLFNLGTYKNYSLAPDYIICAKKAQLGIVVSSNHIERNIPEFSKASLFRGYYQASIISQLSDQILKIEDFAQKCLSKFIGKFNKHLHSPRITGLAFSFDFKDESKVSQFVEKRFNYGLLFYPAGSETLRFRLNTSFKQEDIEYLFQALDAIANEVYNSKKAAKLDFKPNRRPELIDELYELQTNIVHQKLFKVDQQKQYQVLSGLLKIHFELKVIEIDKENFETYKESIWQIQLETYEKQRQTDIVKFELTAKSEHSVFLGLLDKSGKLKGICVAGAMKLYPYEKGLREIDSFNNEMNYYMLDTTIHRDMQGKGIGLYLRYALFCKARELGVETIWGRNRDHMAAKMYEINTSLGAFEFLYLREDYKDNQPYRDVIVYKSNIQNKEMALKLRSGRYSDYNKNILSKEFISTALPSLVNKTCLSNFVSSRLISEVDFLSSLYPKSLSHHYLASGQSECVDKIVKSIWYKNNCGKKLISFQKHFFGDGSFLSRALSQSGQDFFPSKIFECPKEDNYAQVLKDLEAELKIEDALGIFVEPRLQFDLSLTPANFLVQLKTLCKKYKTPLIYNESCSSFYRYNDHFVPSNDEKLTPDASFSYLEGQCAFISISEEYFLSKPLMLISTWDGDEFSYLKFAESVRYFEKNKEKNLNTRRKFQEKMLKILNRYNCKVSHLHHGQGCFRGQIPLGLQALFYKNYDKYLVCPRTEEMERFLKEYS